MIMVSGIKQYVKFELVLGTKIDIHAEAIFHLLKPKTDIYLTALSQGRKAFQEATILIKKIFIGPTKISDFHNVYN